MTALPTRDTARGLILDPDNRLLLIEYEAARDVDPQRPGLRRFWFTPGGGVEPGETYQQAAIREMEEEVGVANVDLGPWIARRETPLLLFRRQRFVRERYFLIRLPPVTVDIARLALTENDPVLDARWWPLDELERSPDVVEPRGVIDLAKRIAAGDTPTIPVELA